MSNTNTESTTHNVEPRSANTLQRSERIRKKSLRIAEKSKKISERNALLYPSFAQSTVEDAPDEAVAPGSTEQENKPTAKKTRRERLSNSKKHDGIGFSVSAILSAVAIILLVSLAVGLIFDLIPSGRRELAFINISDSNDTHEGEYADSSTLTKAMSSVVVVSATSPTGASTGAGFIVSVSEDGNCDYIATNYHVVANMENIHVRLYESGDYVEATLVGFSEEDDIAVLKTARSGLPALTMANYKTCRIGDAVYAIGTPEGENFSWSVTQGIISAIDRILWDFDDNGTLEKTMRVLQTDTPVNPGNSGGPLINAAGEVVGIVTLKLGESEGMGFALPIDGAIEIISAIIEVGSADNIQSTISNKRGLLGITCVGVTEGHWYKLFSDKITESDAINGSFRADASGVYVMSVQANTAAHGKLKAGDIITEINGMRIHNLAQLSNIIYNMKVGDEVTLTYCRGGKYYSAAFTLGGQS